MLAELGRTNALLLAPITHRSEQAQSDLCVLRARDELVRARTGMINHVRGVLKSNGHRAPTCSADSFGRKASTAIPANLESGLRPVMTTIAALTAAIAGLDKQIEQLCAERYPITQALPPRALRAPRGVPSAIRSRKRCGGSAASDRLSRSPSC